MNNTFKRHIIYKKRYKNKKKKYKWIMIYIFFLLLSFFLTYLIIFHKNGNLHVSNLSNASISKNKINTNNFKENIVSIELNDIKSVSNNYNLNYISDNSITKFVSSDNSFQNLNYTPNDLVKVDSKYIISSKDSLQLRNIAFQNLESLSKDFYNYFNVPLIIVSAYRDYLYQKGIEINNKECVFEKLCAKAGYSEHQTGLAIDIFDTSTKEEFLKNHDYQKYFEWMNKNAYKYGFHNSYQNGIEIDGYGVEPWHRRYLGNNLAKYLKSEGITFTEYYNKLKK
ncbi:MAG: M15 family metallopeptidase [Candidatus Gracilibacteria bacterium]|nr:M15 family metallopeptidase [Candidatus Gracilibacteria bacterium]